MTRKTQDGTNSDRRTLLKGIGACAGAVGGFARLGAGRPGDGSLVSEINSEGYYTSTLGPVEVRSKNPLNRDLLIDHGHVRHQPHGGGVKLTMRGHREGRAPGDRSPAVDVGFYLPVGTLDEINRVDVDVAGGESIQANLWFDEDGDGFFHWVTEKNGHEAKGNDAFKDDRGHDSKALGGTIPGGSFDRDDGIFVMNGAGRSIRDISGTDVAPDVPTALWVGQWRPPEDPHERLVENVEVS